MSALEPWLPPSTTRSGRSGSKPRAARAERHALSSRALDSVCVSQYAWTVEDIPNPLATRNSVDELIASRGPPADRDPAFVTPGLNFFDESPVWQGDVELNESKRVVRKLRFSQTELAAGMRLEIRKHLAIEKIDDRAL